MCMTLSTAAPHSPLYATGLAWTLFAGIKTLPTLSSCFRCQVICQGLPAQSTTRKYKEDRQQPNLDLDACAAFMKYALTSPAVGGHAIAVTQQPSLARHAGKISSATWHAEPKASISPFAAASLQNTCNLHSYRVQL